MESRPRRINGFEPPYSFEQMATWVLYPLIVLHFYLFLQPLLWTDEDGLFRVIIPVVFSISALVVGYGVQRTCSIDACDPSLLEDDDEPVQVPTDLEPPARRHCYKCYRDVDKQSLHCILCNKCVKRYDHHCKWLNTCVGERNYPYFLVTCCGIFVLTTLSLVLNTIYLIEAFDDASMQQARMQGRYIPVPELAVQIVAIAASVVLFPLAALVWQLCVFHCFLLYQGITTYEYIVMESKKKQQRAKEARNAGQREAQLQKTEKSRMQRLVENSRSHPVGSGNPSGPPEDEEGGLLALKGQAPAPATSGVGWTPPPSPPSVDASTVKLTRLEENNEAAL